MGARQKLNSIYLGVAAVIAGFVGLMFKSAWLFVICLGGIAAALMHDGSVRTSPVRRRKN